MALTLLLSVAAPALALAEPLTAGQAAGYLYEHGLFKGTGTDENGAPIFNLDSTATRAEGVTMFVRLLSKETEATTNTYATPFTDVPAWAKGYVGYAYQSGLTKGTGATTFSSMNLMSAYEFLTLCLRALGYAEGADFTYTNPRTLASSLGIIAADGWQDNTGEFLRGDMVMMAYHTLFAKKADGTTIAADSGLSSNTGVPASDLTDKRVETGIIDAGDSKNLLPNGEGDNMLPLENVPDGTIITRADMVYTPGSSDNLANFSNILYEINKNLEWTGKGIGYFSNTLTYISTKDNNWLIRVSNWSAGKDHRNLFLTSLVYFGNKNMATAVYGMLDEHYRFRSDSSVPITEELAGKYGLTIKSQTEPQEGIVFMTATNGSST